MGERHLFLCNLRNSPFPQRSRNIPARRPVLRPVAGADRAEIVDHRMWASIDGNDMGMVPVQTGSTKTPTRAAREPGRRSWCEIVVPHVSPARFPPCRLRHAAQVLLPSRRPVVVDSRAAPTPTLAFADRLVRLANSGALALMISIGHRSGLFDVMACLPPATSAEIAANAVLEERYVREWLAAMAAGHIVQYDPQHMTFSLPAEHAARLTRSAGRTNDAAGFQALAILGAAEDQIVECFRHGGGIAAPAFPRYDAVRAEATWAALDSELLSATLPLVPGLMDRLRAGIEVADVACGHGHAVNIMAEAFPASRFVGWDPSSAGVRTGRVEARRKQLGNVQFEQRDVAEMEEHARFDFIASFNPVHDHPRPDLVFRGVAAALRPEAIFLCAETGAYSNFGHNLKVPAAPRLYTSSCMYSIPVSLASGGLAVGAMWAEAEARRMFAEAGFVSVKIKRRRGDPINCFYIARKPGDRHIGHA
jgi:SAM-dependent methyltransferase